CLADVVMLLVSQKQPSAGLAGSQHPTPKCNPWNRPWRAQQTRMEALASRCARACRALHSGAVVRLANLAVTLHTSRRAGYRAAQHRPRVAPRHRSVL
ncbi:hypothetical protein ALC62_04366, partial [Cyphomyrmex costatus]